MDKKFIVPFKEDKRFVWKDLRKEGFKDRGDWYHNYYLHTKHWKRIRSKQLKLQGRKCLCCSKGAKVVHHCKYNDLDTYKNYSGSVLSREIFFKHIIGLCLIHHAKEHPEHLSTFIKNGVNNKLREYIDEKILNECDILAIKYINYKSETWKNKTRNKLFIKLEPLLLRNVEWFFKKKNNCKSKQEILSITWDYFCFCLKYYKNTKIPFRFHIYKIGKFFFYNLNNDKSNYKIISNSKLKKLIDFQFNEHPYPLCDLLIDINKFKKEHVPKNHNIVFNDTIESISSNHIERVYNWKKGCGISKRSYFELKKAYAGVINWIINDE